VNELGEEDRALLDLARDADAPSERDRARVRAALASRLGAAAGLTAITGVAATSQAVAGTATIGTGTTVGGTVAAGGLGAGVVATKLVGVAIVVSAAMGVGATAVRHARHPRASVVALAQSKAASGGATPAPPGTVPFDRPAAPQSALPLPEPTAGSSNPAPVAPRIRAKPATGGRVPWTSRDESAGHSPAPSTRSTVAVAEEAGLINAGVVALRSGHPARALELFDRHALLYPQGVLAEERDAERALSLADLDRHAEARTAIQEFLRARPQSPLAARLRNRLRLLDAATP
jgi:hypothetical protein